MSEIDVKIAKLEERADTNEEYHKKLNGSLDKIWKVIGSLRDNLVDYKVESDKKPSWSIAVLIGGLLSMCTAMATYILMVAK